MKANVERWACPQAAPERQQPLTCGEADGPLRRVSRRDVGGRGHLAALDVRQHAVVHLQSDRTGAEHGAAVHVHMHAAGRIRGRRLTSIQQRGFPALVPHTIMESFTFWMTVMKLSHSS